MLTVWAFLATTFALGSFLGVLLLALIAIPLIVLIESNFAVGETYPKWQFTFTVLFLLALTGFQPGEAFTFFRMHVR